MIRRNKDLTFRENRVTIRTLPDVGRGFAAPAGAVLFLTTCLTITGTGAGGNSRDKSAGEQIYQNKTRRKCLNGNRKEVLKRFGSERFRRFKSCHPDQKCGLDRTKATGEHSLRLFLVNDIIYLLKYDKAFYSKIKTIMSPTINNPIKY